MLSENNCRTGTQPFMAIELLTAEGPIRRRYKHGAESFFWVVVYDSTYHGLVNGWGLLTNQECAAQKWLYLGSGTRTFKMSEEHQPIVSWVNEVREFLKSGMTEKDWGIDELIIDFVNSDTTRGAHLPHISKLARRGTMLPLLRDCFTFYLSQPDSQVGIILYIHE